MNKFRNDMTDNELHLRTIMDELWEAAQGRPANTVHLDTAFDLLHGIATSLAWHGEDTPANSYTVSRLDRARPADPIYDTERCLAHAEKQARARATHHLLDGSKTYADYRDAANVIESARKRATDAIASA